MALSARSRTTPCLPYAGDRHHLYLAGRPLDFCLLALCSFLLSLLCHQTGGVASQTATAATSSPPQIDFVIKAGLATASRQGTEIEDEESQS